MISRRAIRTTASGCVGLVLLLLSELPALGYPASQSGGMDAAVEVGAAVVPVDRFLHRSPIEVRRASARQAATGSEGLAADDVGRWEPTLSEGAVFTALGSGMLLGGGIVLGVGMARLIPIVTEAAGLVTIATNPLLLMGLGLTLLIVGIAFLAHGVEVLQVVRAMEEQAAKPAAEWSEPAGGSWTAWRGSQAGAPRATVVLRF